MTFSWEVHTSNLEKPSFEAEGYSSINWKLTTSDEMNQSSLHGARRSGYKFNLLGHKHARCEVKP
jgi:hypothetical protein